MIAKVSMGEKVLKLDMAVFFVLPDSSLQFKLSLILWLALRRKRKRSFVDNKLWQLEDMWRL